MSIIFEKDETVY